MDSDEDSSSDDSVSSSGSSDDSSSQEEDRLEPARILGTTFELPQDLCENPEIFKEFLSQSTWDSLSEANTRHLKKFLPKFPENDEAEKDITVQKLFARETFKFTSPLVDFHKKLRDGAFRPDIARMQRVLQKAKQQHIRHQWRQEWYQTMQEVLVSRERLLAVAGRLPPGVQPRVAPPPLSMHPPAPSQPALQIRTKKRYFQELAAIRSEVCGEGGTISDDENFPEGPPLPLTKNQKRNSVHIQSGDGNGVVSTLGPSRSTGPNLSEEWRRKALTAHKRRKQLYPDHPEFMTAGITLDSIHARCGSFIANGSDIHPHMIVSRPPPKRQRRPPAPPRRVPASPTDSNSDIDPTSLHTVPNINSDFIKIEPGLMKSRGKCSPSPPPLLQQQAPPPPVSLPPPPPPVISPVTVKVENPVVEESLVPEDSSVELVQETHVCFFSVLRDLVCGTTRQCLPLPAITAGLRKWRQNPIAPLNHWYSAVDDWVKALPSAVAFLAGETANLPEDFVPYLQYKPANQVYQWIGAGRDTDNHLQQLCTQWLAHRKAAANPQNVNASSNVSTMGVGGSTMGQHAPQHVDRPPSPPVTKWNAKWQASPSELESFRMQERIRFQRPHRAFTYRLPRGNSVVGPLRGVYACDENDGKRGARGHSLLAPGRPRHVTLLALVRDAVACLPGGEGTRAHITSLLRRSQYLVPEAPEQALQAAVSGALDRMHGAPDPCVRYLPVQKVWQYLHRDRTEEEFERLHAENQNKGKSGGSGGGAGGSGAQNKRPSSAKPRVRSSKAKPAPTPAATLPTPPAPVIKTNMNISMESDGDGEDANVDVEGTDAVPDIIVPPVVIKAENHNRSKQETSRQEKVNRKESLSRQDPSNRLEIIGKQEVVGRHEIVVTTKESTPRSEFTNRQEVISNRQEMVTRHEPVKRQELQQATSRQQESNVKQDKHSRPDVVGRHETVISRQESIRQEIVSRQEAISRQEMANRHEAISRQDATTRQESVGRHVEVVTRQPEPSTKIDMMRQEASKIDRAGTPTKSAPQQTIVIQTSSQAPTSLLQSDKIISIANTLSSSILQHQPRSTVTTPSVVRQSMTGAGSRSVVRVLNPTASGKSLISPQALKPSTPPPTIARTGTSQAKVIVQRPQGQNTGHQRVVLESLIQHQRGGQTISHDQLFHTIQSTQKIVTSSAGTPNQTNSPTKTQSGSIGQTIQLAGQTVQLPSGQTVQLTGQTVQLTGQTVQLTGQTVQLGGQTVQLAGQTVQLGSGQTVQTVQLGNGQTMQLGSGQTVQLGSGQTVQLGSGQTVQLGSGQTMQLGSGQTVQLSGQTVQLANGQTVHLGGGQTVQLSNGQTVQLTSGQTVQLGSGQAVQLGGGQTVQLTSGQTVARSGNDLTLRGTPQRQTTPLVAKILTNAQVRGGNIMQGARVATPGTQGALRVAGLSLAQLQGKPVLLHTSSSGTGNSNILLQASGGGVTGQNIITANAAGGGAGSNNEGVAGGQQRTVPATSAPQHTLLLSNIVSSRGQVVRVASGGGHILGPTLRLQAAAPNAQVQARPGATNVMLGGQALKLQTSPIRLHQGAGGATIAGQGGNRVLLASGTRLHGLKLLPVQHALARGGGVTGRQVYARIVGPGAAAGAQATIVRAAPPNVITTQPSNTTPQQRNPPQ